MPVPTWKQLISNMLPANLTALPRPLPPTPTIRRFPIIIQQITVHRKKSSFDEQTGKMIKLFLFLVTNAIFWPCKRTIGVAKLNLFDYDS